MKLNAVVSRDMLRSFAMRFKEPSSWAGLTGLLALVGANLDPSFVQSCSYIGAGICGLLAFFIPESKSTP